MEDNPLQDSGTPSSAQSVDVGSGSSSAPRAASHTNATPARPKVAAYQLFEGTIADLKTTRQRILHETHGHYVGPMPVKDFFNDFMPWNEEIADEYKVIKVPRDRKNGIKKLCEGNEAQSYVQIIDSLQRWRALSAPIARNKGPDGDRASEWQELPRLTFRDSHSYRDRACLSYGVDISVYSGDLFVPRDKPPVMDFANLHSWIEVKPTSDYDPFDDDAVATGEADDLEEDEERYPDNDGDDEEEEQSAANQLSTEVHDSDGDSASGNRFPPREFMVEANDDIDDLTPLPDPIPFEKNSAKACDTRAQLASYAGVVMATQYRGHLFTVVVTGKYARFIRWDRSCAIVTRRIDITTNPLPFFEFFKRFRQLSLEQRGTNPHVRPATKEETVTARNLLKNKAPELWLGVSGWLFLKEKSVDIRTQPFSMLEYDGTKFLVPNPHCPERGLSPFGRGSRGTVAVKYNEDNPEESTQCFLKDGWRDTHRISEAEIYPRLKDAGVRNIAEMICGGDWFSPTLGHGYKTKPWLGENPRQRARVRRLQGCLLVLAEVGYPLIAFPMAYDLVGGVADAMEAYEDAISKAGVMHRDLSPFNILLVKTGKDSKTGRDSFKGILIDWDHAVLMGSALRGTWRTGTWQFMSVSLLKSGTAHEPEDDRESSFYSLFWTSIRHLRGAMTQAQLRELLEAFDERRVVLNDDNEIDVRGGNLKHDLLLQDASERDFRFSLQPMTRLIQDLAYAFTQRYIKPPNETRKSAQAKALAAQLAQETADYIERTIKNPAWMVGRLREAEEELRQLGHPPIPTVDWVNNVPEQTTTGMSTLLKGLQRSQFHLYPTTGTGTSTLKRAAPDSADEVEQGVGDLELEDESAERVKKRIRTKGKKEDDDQ
ncbi:hypothetical protein NMY22_g2858 [Coprinellus aureogranulatus]|nr:hypothetical protein NMY22_g2858 [Coprinellus aureogranulatus]